MYAVAGVVLVLFLLLVTFWDTGYQKHRAPIAPARPAEDEDECDYDEDGELVKVEQPVQPRLPGAAA